MIGRLLCRVGWHNMRWFIQPDDAWKPQCVRCRTIAPWWTLEREAL